MAVRILRFPEVLTLTGVSRKTIERWYRARRFPAPIKLGDGPHAAIGFRSDEVQEWLDNLPRAE